MKIAIALSLLLTTTFALAQDDFVPGPSQVVFTKSNAIAAPSIADCSVGLHYFVKDPAAAQILIRENRMLIEPAGTALEVVNTILFYGVHYTNARIWGTDTYLWFVSAGLTAFPPTSGPGKWYSAKPEVSERLDYVVEQRKSELQLNEKYKEAMSRLDPAQKEKLRAEERRWVAERDKVKGDAKAFLQSTKERIALLDSFLAK